LTSSVKVKINYRQVAVLVCRSQNKMEKIPFKAPVVKVTRKADYDGLETLVCQVHGFYPKEIEANWVKDGEVWQEGTLRGLVAPNSDGTYYLLLSVQIDPEERERFRCRVEHDTVNFSLILNRIPHKKREKLTAMYVGYRSCNILLVQCSFQQ
uniref:Ig-like domain-containing protein n=1 Tax=Podarcis muralis TaxID=64176 RepID=A0A670HP12_PODMU